MVQLDSTVAPGSGIDEGNIPLSTSNFISLDHSESYKQHEVRNMIMLSLFFTVYFGFRSGCLIVLPLSSKLLLFDELGGVDDSPWYQFPLALWFIMDICLALPNAIFMRRCGRRAGFMLGSTCAFVASIFAFLVLRFVSHKVLAFILLNVAILPMSVIGMAEFVKYAASESCLDESRRSKVVSTVITGGAVISIVSPFTSSFTADIEPGDPLDGYAYYFIFLAIMAIVGFCATYMLDLPPVTKGGQGATPSLPLTSILARTDVWSSVFVQVAVQFMMVTPMSGTPLAMVDHLGMKPGSFWISGCIVAHVLSMFIPGLFTGHIIIAVGKYPVMSIGILFQIACMVVTLMSYRISTFYVGLVLLGVGWNFSFVASTILLLASHSPEERTKVTACNEILRFGANAIGSILSSTLDWNALCYVCLGCSVLVAGVALLMMVRQR